MANEKTVGKTTSIYVASKNKGHTWVFDGQARCGPNGKPGIRLQDRVERIPRYRDQRRYTMLGRTRGFNDARTGFANENYNDFAERRVMRIEELQRIQSFFKKSLYLKIPKGSSMWLKHTRF